MSERYLVFSGDIDRRAHETMATYLLTLNTQGVKRLTIGMSSGGGNVDVGAAICNLMRAMPFEIVTHNTGNVNSAAILMFLGGAVRRSNPDCYFGFHSGGIDLSQAGTLNEADLELKLHAVRTQNTRMIEIIAARTGRPPKDLSRFFKGETIIGPADAAKNGLITQVSEFRIPPGAVVHSHT